MSLNTKQCCSRGSYVVVAIFLANHYLLMNAASLQHLQTQWVLSGIHSVWRAEEKQWLYTLVLRSKIWSYLIENETQWITSSTWESTAVTNSQMWMKKRFVVMLGFYFTYKNKSPDPVCLTLTGWSKEAAQWFQWRSTLNTNTAASCVI